MNVSFSTELSFHFACGDLSREHSDTRIVGVDELLNLKLHTFICGTIYFQLILYGESSCGIVDKIGIVSKAKQRVVSAGMHAGASGFTGTMCYSLVVV